MRGEVDFYGAAKAEVKKIKQFIVPCRHGHWVGHKEQDEEWMRRHPGETPTYCTPYRVVAHRDEDREGWFVSDDEFMS